MSSSTRELMDLEKKVMLGTYSRPSMVISHGKGVYLYDMEGKAYLDFVSGISVNALGYGDTDTMAAIQEQAARLIHCSNLYYTEPQIRLADFLTQKTFADKVFFSNSGTEAMEGAFKIARRFGKEKKGDGCHRIIAMKRSFHGRTFGALSATGQPKLQENFGPMLEGFSFADFNVLPSVENLMAPDVCAVVLEPVQGEGGIYPAEAEFLKGIRELCNANESLLIFDEIQCGLGRTGRFSCHEHYGIEPDIMAIAKPIAGGIPLGAVLLTDRVAEVMGPGSHGSTFGGGPLACHVALTITRKIADPLFLEKVFQMGDYLKTNLWRLEADNEMITGIRGKGLMLGIGLDRDPKPLIDACLEEGLLVCKTGENAIRLLPPLVLQKDEADEAIQKLGKALTRVAEADAKKSA